MLYPMRVVLISARADSKDNVMAAAWCTPLSFEPPMFGVAISKKRFTYGLIRKSGAFAINLVSPDMKQKMLICGSKTGKGIDKFELAGLKKQEGKRTILVGDSPASIECEVVSEMETGDHVFLAGKVINVIRRKDGGGLYHFGGDVFGEV